MSENKIDPRMQVIIDLIPADAPLFRVTRCSQRLYWRPESHGYTSEYNPFWAGFYEREDYYAADNSDHSSTVDAREALQDITVPDGWLMAMLVDGLTKARAERDRLHDAIVDGVEAHRYGSSARDVLRTLRTAIGDEDA